ncbi:MAG: cation-transporting P-type ATPase, partial [Methanoculleus sp.]|nr:cation-transporting P-type ATPase [Methanoculleus sp.]
MEHEAISTDEARGMAVDDLYGALSSRREGLSQSEANDRIRTFGYNELPEKKESAVKKFLRYFWGPIPWMIEAALIISAAIGRWEDFAIILALLLVNAIVGF